MPRWLFVLCVAALVLGVSGIVLTFLRTGPAPERPAATAPRGAAP